MLTLITGTPGAAKTLYAVSEIAAAVPGSTVEKRGVPIPRRLFSNIKDLRLEHTHIDGDDLNKWQTWVKPGDVIVFDEVQEVWRPRGLGIKVPECIAALETHRHMGVDIILITQHPMLVDPNIRRLVNQHLHLRRLPFRSSWLYEWDHCANPGQVRTCIQSKVWFHKTRAYDLYTSAQLHTKPVTRIPRIAYVGLLALGGLAYMAPVAYNRVTGSLGASSPAKPVPVASSPFVPSSPALPVPEASESIETPAGSSLAKPEPVFAGCLATRSGACSCFDVTGRKVDQDPEVCTAFDRPPPMASEDLPEPVPVRVFDPDEADVFDFLGRLKRKGQASVTDGLS
ncbi:MAG: hypothetical protein K2Y15_13435 [Burkholderiaceae bacterium]|nr:hypothetical protein [Burkholderiaceae bacterium]